MENSDTQRLVMLASGLGPQIPLHEYEEGLVAGSWASSSGFSQSSSTRLGSHSDSAFVLRPVPRLCDRCHHYYRRMVRLPPGTTELYGALYGGRESDFVASLLLWSSRERLNALLKYTRALTSLVSSRSTSNCPRRYAILSIHCSLSLGLLCLPAKVEDCINR